MNEKLKGSLGWTEFVFRANIKQNYSKDISNIYSMCVETLKANLLLFK